MRMGARTLVCVAALLSAPASSAASSARHSAASSPAIRPGTPWYDTDGNRIYAGGANIFQEEVGGALYMVGEGRKVYGDCSECLNLYSSASGALGGPWSFEACLLNNSAVVAPPPFDREPYYRMERPKLFKCPGTARYMLWFHCDTEGFAMSSVGVLSADAVAGPYAFVSPCFKPDGQDSYDQGTFVDDLAAGGDGRAYHIRSVRNSFAGISQMNAECTNTTGIVSSGPDMEGQALMRDAGGVLHAAGSHLTGWSPNAAQFVTTSSRTLVGAQWGDNYNPSGSPTTYDSQSTFVFPFAHPGGGGRKTFVFMADRWNDSGPGGLDNMTLVWLPMLPPNNGSSSSPSAPAAPGWQLALGVCDPGDARQGFALTAGNAVLHSASGLCVRQQASAGEGAPIVLAVCDGSAGETWYAAGSTIASAPAQGGGGGGSCVNWNNANQILAQGNPVIAWACGDTPSWNAEWDAPAAGAPAQAIQALDRNGQPSGFCAAVEPPPAPAWGWFVQLDNCDPASPLQQFVVNSSSNTVAHAPTGLCVQQQDAGGPGASLILAECGGGGGVPSQTTWYALGGNTLASSSRGGADPACVSWNNDNQVVSVVGNPVIPYACGDTPSWNAAWQLPAAGSAGAIQALDSGGQPSTFCASVMPPYSATQWTIPWYSEWKIEDFQLG